MLLDVETRYNDLEKMVLALVTAKKKLRHYFESHKITVVTNYPIRQILSKPDLFGKLTKWVIELGIYEIEYIPRAAKKSQAIADFLVEIQSFKPTEKELAILPEEGIRWILNTVGASNNEGAGIRVVIESSLGVIIEEAFHLEEPMTNNDAEYKALIYGLELALKLGVQNLKVLLDSELVSWQVNRIFEAKDQRMKAYYNRVS